MSTEERQLDSNLKEAIRASFLRLRDNLPGFRPRPSQNVMIGAVARALGTSGGRAVVEAPTGTGKSMAYLTPAVQIGLTHARKVVISTATVALQEQVFNRDIPAFLKATGLSAKVALAKGRNRYACVTKLHELAGKSAAQDELFEGLETAAWARPPQSGEVKLVETLVRDLDAKRWNGDLDNPPVTVADDLKPMMTVAAGACTGRRCPHYRECPVQKARAALKQADVIVSNHDLTIASLKQALNGDEDTPNFLAPPGESLYVFDEGHTLPRVAVDAGAAQIHLPSAIQRTAKLRKLFAAVYRMTGENRVGGSTLADAHALIERYLEALNAIQSALQTECPAPTTSRDTLWRAAHGALPDQWRSLARDCRQAVFNIHSWMTSASSAAASVEGQAERKDKLYRQLGMASEHAHGGWQLWSAWSRPGEEQMPMARWVALGSDGGLVCHASEVSAASFLREALWDVADSVVVTSATLSEGGDFALLARQLGLPEESETLSLPSPFNLQKQAVLRVPKFPVLPDHPDHPKAIAAWLASNLDWDAGSLVLFTSRRKMLQTAEHLPADLRAKVRLQGETSKQAMIAAHTTTISKGEGAVLFGLLSLGEGLDLPGKLVTHVVCTQIPFAVPEDPVGKTLAEWIEASGGNPFFDIALPAATRTLTQFAGRLVRTETDEGTISVLDSRLIRKRYGQTIIDALPPFRREIAC